MAEINLALLTNNGEVKNLAGHDRGLAARQHFELDALEHRGEPVVVRIPEDLKAISPSFFQGMFAESVRKYGSRAEFLRHYSFDAETLILQQIDGGIRSSLMPRRALV